MTYIAMIMLAMLQAPADPVPSVDELLDKLAATQKQQAELQKTAEGLSKDIRDRLAALQKRLEELGVKPPEPPKPPEPADPFFVAVRAAYAADPSPKKLESLELLIELYRQAQTLAATSTGPNISDVIERVKAARDALLVAGLDGVRRVISAEMAAIFPEDMPLDDATRAKLAGLYKRVESALKQSK